LGNGAAAKKPVSQKQQETEKQRRIGMRNGNGSRSGLLKTAGILLVIEFAILFIPLFILGSAINWPASLDEPAAVNLPLILENYGAMMTGYGIYLIYSLLFWPVAYFAGRAIVGSDTENTLFRLANGFAILSVMARCLGIVRWLFTMPILGALYTDPSASHALKDSISMVYEMLNSYAGGVGELLGVSLFAVIWLVIIGVLILQRKEWPNWLGYFGFVAAASLFVNLAEATGMDMGPMITISVVLLHFWMLFMGITMLRKA